MQPIQCRECGVLMERGVSMDYWDDHRAQATQWAPGTTRKQGFFLFGKFALTKEQESAMLAIVVFRCPKCFRLESFAPPKSE